MERPVLRVLTTVFAVAFGVLSAMISFAGESSVTYDEKLHPTLLEGTSFVLALGASVLLVWRHRWPELVCAIALVPPLVASDSMAALIALAAVAAKRRDHYLGLMGAAVLAVTSWAVWRDASWHESDQIIGTWVPSAEPGKVIVVLVTSAVFTAIPLFVGVLYGTRADLRERERREAVLRAEMTRREERSRIAHEMHDVLGHRLSLLSLQAGALEVSAPAAGDAAAAVRTTAKQSLDDLRQVIGVLRDGRDFHLHGPVPTLADLPPLVAQTRQVGVPVNLTVMLDQATAAPAPLAIAVYRIVQESLTNVLRHAPGAPTEVTVRGGPGAGVTLEVVNFLVAGAPPSPGSGSGLTGIGERVAALGGRATIGPTANNTFVVQAWLPWP